MNVIAKERWEKDIEKYDLPHLRLRQVAELVKQINPPAYVDLGCAKGTLGKLTPGINYIGCDFAMPEGDYNFKFYHCNFNNSQLPSEIKGQPLITCSGLLEYIENLDSFLNQVNNALANNGVLIASYFNMNHISRIRGMLKGKSFPVHPDWRGFFSPDDFIKKLDQSGFTVERIVPVSHGFASSPPVSDTTEEKCDLSSFRFYSKSLAHQLIFVCRKTNVFLKK